MNTEYDKLIKTHYDGVASEEKNSGSSTMANSFVRDSETNFIANMVGKYLNKREKSEGLKVLDVGCGNGYTLGKLAPSFPELSFAGLELTDSLREIANESLASQSISVAGRDIRKMDMLKEFDVDILICQRVIINLLDQNDQKEALQNLLNIVNNGGLLIFIECFDSGLQSLNKARKEFGLDEMSPSHHNLYLNDDFFNLSGLKEFDLSQKEFLSSHYFVSRAIHPIFLSLNKQEFIRNSEFVSFFTKSFQDSIGTYSPIKFLSFVKNGKN
tara:strand:- start:595 stop:1407 length:813 start_codon:yes stop_codon:yes gene_type:complete